MKNSNDFSTAQSMLPIFSGLLAVWASYMAKNGNIAGCVLINIAMWFVYKLALDKSSSSVRVQSINMVTQIAASVFVGHFFMGENAELKNYIQIFVLSFGVYLLE
eukprot:NODE_168_length_14557_cov_0.729008.p12 type:complete len:105 gc:universal NODE_168_length_14557_cov_0.729008:10520-10834(+)